jgi:ABC-2 type transport system permease protein
VVVAADLKLEPVPKARGLAVATFGDLESPPAAGMAILFTSIFSGIGLLWDRQFGFLKETLVAPVPRLQIMAGRTLGGATVAIIQGTLVLCVCLIAGFRPHGVQPCRSRCCSWP